MQSAELIAHNEDLLSQILILLPLKPLMRLKCVSKHWHSFISSPQFARTYTLSKLNEPPTGIIITPNDGRARIRNYVSLRDRTNVFDKSVHSLKFLNVPLNYINILGTCNGLTLCRCGSRSRAFKYDPNVTYYVCNLATKQFKALPSFRSRQPLAKSGQLQALSFDPFVSPHYQVCVGNVSLIEVPHYFRCEFRVFSSETGKWSPAMRLGIPSRVSITERLCTSWNSWIFCGYSYEDQSCWYLDIDNLCMGSLDLPSPNPNYSDIVGRRIKPNLHVCNSRLFLIDIGETIFINIYEMEKSTGWTLKYDVCYYQLGVPHFVIHLNPRFDGIKVVSIVGGRRDGKPLLIVKVAGKLSCFNIKEKKSKVILRRRSLCLSSGTDIYGHFETLAQP